MKKLKIARTGYLVISYILYVLGIICITQPGDITGDGIILSGGILITYGIIKMIGYFSKELYCLAFQYDFACGLFLMVIGTLLVCMNNRFSEYILYCLGILVLWDSLLGIQTSVEARRFGLGIWPFILAISILSGTTGVLLLLTNSQTVAGIALIAVGLMRHCIIKCTVYTSPSV